MESKNVKRRADKQSRSPKKLKKSMFFSLVAVVLLVVGTYWYFQNHFLPTAKVNQIAVGWLTVDAAEAKLVQLNETDQIVIKTGTSEKKINIPEKYLISKEYLQKNLHKLTVKVPVSKTFVKELQARLSTLKLPEGTPAKNAEIQWVNDAYQIVAETKGTVVDQDRLFKQIIADVEKGTGNYTYNVTDFYQKPAITKDNRDLVASLAKLNRQLAKMINLTINGETVSLSKEELRNLLNANGAPDNEKVTAFLTQLDAKYGSANQPVLFTDVHGTTRKYKNNGSYGWGIDLEQAKTLLTQALTSDQATETVILPITGNSTQGSKIANDYVEIDLNDQKMYCFIGGKKIVETNVITGRYNKGTATVPGFHTILYKTTNVNLEGTMLDGSSYSVPVKYWMPLISAGGVVTQIGIHDSDHKLDRFGDKQAYKTTAGSNGCINTPGTEVAKIYDVAYEGLPVIIYGNIYDSAPGEFDKPVDYGEIVK
ncbi:L,D-transpeptidase family protein [Enterococcus faecalis]